ncbi:MAG TPA: hypothetical protein VG944_21810 [Fimbriimonas sp.]|nr:hypothetical protein [Fimbriimonas sp.]
MRLRALNLCGLALLIFGALGCGSHDTTTSVPSVTKAAVPPTLQDPSISQTGRDTAMHMGAGRAVNTK